jgi:Ca-activated chloride channel family protein
MACRNRFISCDIGTGHPRATLAEKNMERQVSMKRLLFIVIICVPSFLLAQPGRKKVIEGNQLFMEEKFDEANNKYQDALLDNPNSLEIQYNVGDVLYKKNDFEKALEMYDKVLNTDDPLFQSKVYYNMGNTLYRQQKLPESIQAYEHALKLNPDDVDAKYNLEFVRNKLKQNAQPQQNQQEDQQKQEQEEQQQKQQEQQSQEAQQDEREMSKEEAEQLLNALKENQEDMKKKQAQAGSGSRVVKDW